jgi:hypothetical protein
MMFYESAIKKDPNYWNSPAHRNLAMCWRVFLWSCGSELPPPGRMIAYLDMRRE